MGELRQFSECSLSDLWMISVDDLPRYPPNIPKISPEYSQDILKYPQVIPNLSPGYPPDGASIVTLDWMEISKSGCLAGYIVTMRAPGVADEISKLIKLKYIILWNGMARCMVVKFFVGWLDGW